MSACIMYAQCTRDVACAFGPGTAHKGGPWAVVAVDDSAILEVKSTYVIGRRKTPSYVATNAHCMGARAI